MGMKTRIIACILISIVGSAAFSQKLKSVESKIHFFSDAPMEDIEALNTAGLSVMDLSNGNIVFSVPISQFQFDKSLMQEHFNENYLESAKYPKSVFIGKVQPFEFKEGLNQVTVSGEMDLHGVKKEVSVNGIIVKAGERLVAHAEFKILLEDYKIKVPKAVFYNIAEEIAVTVDFTYAPN
jgi:hypothetical protein